MIYLIAVTCLTTIAKTTLLSNRKYSANFGHMSRTTCTEKPLNCQLYEFLQLGSKTPKQQEIKVIYLEWGSAESLSLLGEPVEHPSCWRKSAVHYSTNPWIVSSLRATFNEWLCLYDILTVVTFSMVTHFYRFAWRIKASSTSNHNANRIANMNAIMRAPTSGPSISIPHSTHVGVAPYFSHPFVNIHE